MGGPVEGLGETGGGPEAVALSQGLDLRQTEYFWVMKGARAGHLRSQEAGRVVHIFLGSSGGGNRPSNPRKGTKASDGPCSQDTMHA